MSELAPLITAMLNDANLSTRAALELVDIQIKQIAELTAERDKLRAAIDEAQRVNGKPTAVNSVIDELQRAVIKFPQWPTDPLHAMGIVAEEVGELAKEVLQFVYEPHKSSQEAIRKEALQAAAMLLRFIESLPVYEYRRVEWHAQTKLRDKEDEHCTCWKREVVVPRN